MDMVLVWRSRDRHIHSVFFRETWRKHMSRGAPNLVCSKSFRGSHLNVEKTHARKKLCKNGKCPYFFTCLRFETPGFSVVPSSGRPASQAKWHTPKTKTANPISRRHVEIIHSDLDGSQAKGFSRVIGTTIGRIAVPRFSQSTTTPIFWSFFDKITVCHFRGRPIY
jgi:hypothetical protein